MRNSKHVKRCYRHGALTVAEARESEQKSREKLNALQCVVRAFSKATTLGQQKNEWLKFHATLQDQRREVELSIYKFHRLVHDIEKGRRSLAATEGKQHLPCPCGATDNKVTNSPESLAEATKCSADGRLDDDPSQRTEGLSVPWSPGDLVRTGCMLARLGHTVAAELAGNHQSVGQTTRQRVASRTRSHTSRLDGPQGTAPGASERIPPTGSGIEEWPDAFTFGPSPSFCSTQATPVTEQDSPPPPWSSDDNREGVELLREAASQSVENSRPEQIAAFLKLLRQYGLAVIAAEQELELAHAAAQRDLMASKAAIRLALRGSNISLSQLASNHPASREADSSWEPGELTDEEEAFIDMCTENDDETENTFTGSMFSQVRREYQDEIERLEKEFRADYLQLKGKNLTLVGRKKQLLSWLQPFSACLPDRRDDVQETTESRSVLGSQGSAVPTSDANCVSEASPTSEHEKDGIPVFTETFAENTEGRLEKETEAEAGATTPTTTEQSQADHIGNGGVAGPEGLASSSQEAPPALPEAENAARGDAVLDTFNFICKQFSYPGAPRELLLNRLQLEFPDAPAALLREVTEVHKKIGLVHQRRTGRCAEFAAARLAALKAAKNKYDHLKLSFGGDCVRRKERERQIQKSAELRQKLERQRAAFFAKEAARRRAEEEARAVELDKQEKAEQKERRRQQEMKEKVLQYIQTKEELLQQQQAAAEQKAREEAKESAARRKRDAIRVARRRELDEWKCREREARRREQLRRQEEIMERIRMAAEKLAVIAAADPARVLHTTVAAQSRVEATQIERVRLADPHLGRFKHFGTNHSFDTDKLLRDMRLRLSVALFEAGLHGSRAGHEALLVVPPPKAPNPLHDSGASLW